MTSAQRFFALQMIICCVTILFLITMCVPATLAQSCLTSCPSGQSCGGGCPPGFTPKGNDPVCHWSQSNPCAYGLSNNGCPSSYTSYGSGCCYYVVSPIILDVDGTGFSLTDLANGVLFDFFGDGRLIQVSWPSLSSTNAWLVLDRNGDGRIDDATELFGNLTQQPPPPNGQQRNGFLALAEFDKPENGGNGDGVIDVRDAVYSHLRLWQDKNHDGISTADELKTLPELGVAGINLRYTEDAMRDQNGNLFRYRAKIIREDGFEDGRLAYDVLLISGPRPGNASGVLTANSI